MLYQINHDKCNLCSNCYLVCMENAIVCKDEMFFIDMAWCTDCGSCKEYCIEDAIFMNGVDHEPENTYIENYTDIEKIMELI